MAQYIPKAAVVAEIDRWRDEIKEKEYTNNPKKINRI